KDGVDGVSAAILSRAELAKAMPRRCVTRIRLEQLQERLLGLFEPAGLHRLARLLQSTFAVRAPGRERFVQLPGGLDEDGRVHGQASSRRAANPTYRDCGSKPSYATMAFAMTWSRSVSVGSAARGSNSGGSSAAGAAPAAMNSCEMEIRGSPACAH